MSRPKGRQNNATIAAQAAAAPITVEVSTPSTSPKIDLTGGAPITPIAATEPKITYLPTVEPTAKKVALGTINREKVFRAAPGQLKVHESAKGNTNIKGRMVDENGIVYMTTMFMPLNPATGKAIPIEDLDLPAFLG